jgi:hypothetical protein
MVPLVEVELVEDVLDASIRDRKIWLCGKAGVQLSEHNPWLPIT